MDGPSGSGKSSTSRGVATRLGLRYLDTGAQFRAVTAWMIDHGVDFADPPRSPPAPASPRSSPAPTRRTPRSRSTAATSRCEIRSQEVTDHVSAVASVPEVRQRLLELQRSIIGDGGHRRRGSRHRLGGRPRRRGEALPHRGPVGPRGPSYGGERAGTVEATQADLLRRDKIDSGRAVAPAMMPDGAVHLDTTPYSLEEVVDQVVALVEAWRSPDRTGEPSRMTEALRIDGGELPSTAGVRAPRTWLLTTGRSVPHGIIRTWWDLEIHGAEKRAEDRAGRDGGEPRGLARRADPRDLCTPSGARADQAGDVRRSARRVPRAVGQIELDRFHVDVAAIRVALQGLHDGHAVGVFPEGRRGPGDMASPRAGAAYLALVTGAPVVPGGVPRHPVARWRGRLGAAAGRRLAMTFGDPSTWAPAPGPAPSRTWRTPPRASPTRSCRPSARLSRRPA